ncbi:MAG: VOC family protein [Geminicoccaceae bacterium]|nr:VOC family protein [Geminicoccaceae bacterium]
MIDHISLPVQDLDRSRAFYDRVLGALGHRRVIDQDLDDYVWCGYGEGPEPVFCIGSGKPGPAEPPVPPDGQHVAFQAKDRPTVDRFHAESLAAGATDNGAPGLREHYHPNYYAAFVIDPDGHHLEAVCHTPA